MDDLRYQTLKETRKKIQDIKEFNLPVILKTIEEYEKSGADQLFIEQQRALLEKVKTRLAELEDKEKRLVDRL